MEEPRRCEGEGKRVGGGEEERKKRRRERGIDGRRGGERGREEVRRGVEHPTKPPCLATFGEDFSLQRRTWFCFT